MAGEKFDVVALGELLVDFTDNGLSEQGNPLFEANPGADMRLTEEDLEEMLSFANAAAYLVTTRKGAVRSMPERKQVEAILHDD